MITIIIKLLRCKYNDDFLRLLTYRKSRLLGACAYTSRKKKLCLNNEYALNNEISVHQSVHSGATSVYCIVGVMATQTEETFSTIVSFVRGHHVYCADSTIGTLGEGFRYVPRQETTTTSTPSPS